MNRDSIPPKLLKTTYSKEDLKFMNNQEFIGKETTIDFGRDLRMSQPWRGYPSDEIFTIVRVAKSGLYIVKDSKGNEHPIAKFRINYFKPKQR